eukprot:scaffold20.g7835.t1
MAGPLYHMAEVERWRDFQARGEAYLPPTYEQDGFIHLTADPSLLLTVANHFYVASKGDWLVLVIDPAKFSAEVKFEPAAPVGEKQSTGLLKEQQTDEPLFPHLYGALDLGSVVRELPMLRSSDGSFLGIQGL